MAPNFCCRAVTPGPNFKSKSFSWRKILSWSMIDFSNSLVIMIVSQIYPTFLQNFAFLDDPLVGVNNISIANITNAAICLVLSPILGVLSDYYYLRMPFLGFSALLYGALTCLLYLVSDASWRNFAITMYFFIVFGFRINETFVSSFMPSLCNDRDMGFVSGLGFCVGFLSGTIVLAIVNLLTPQRIMILPTGHIGLNIPMMFHDRQVAMLVTGIIMLLSILPPILMLDNGIPAGEKRPKLNCKVFGDAFVTLGRTFKSGLSVNKYVTLLLMVYLFFTIGVYSGTSVLGQVYTAEGVPHGFTLTVMQTAMTVYNIVVACTSIGYGLIAKYTGSKPLLMFSMIAHSTGCLVSVVWKELANALGIPHDSWAVFWIWTTMMLSALGLGPIQALLRGVIGVISPPEKKCEIFGIMETFQLIGWLIGSISGKELFRAGYRAYYIFPLCWYIIAILFIIFIPIGKVEKKARDENMGYGNATIDEIRLIKLNALTEKNAEPGNLVEGKTVSDAALSETTTSSVSQSDLLMNKDLMSPKIGEGGLDEITGS